MAGFRIPGATYRIQFSLNFRFTDARELVPYLRELGITDLYASPRFQARKGSSHGYDVTDSQRVSSELGTEEEFEELVERLKQYGMGLLLDIVPNHMAATWENPWWRDVLENGPSSAYAGYFDINWHPATTKAAFLQEDKVLLPVLGDLYGNVLENQELVLKLDENGFFVRYYDHRFPLDPCSYRLILERACERAAQEGAAAPQELRSLSEAARQLPEYTMADPSEQERRRREAPELKSRLWGFYLGDATSRQILDQAIFELNGTREIPPSFDALDRLLAMQPYRLAHWKIGMEEINYRRFFDINDLVGLRASRPEVFRDRHRRTVQLAREGKVTGLRIDHIDGLYDPAAYLRMLQQAVALETGEGEPSGFYIVAEKILGEAETLPGDWPVSGTTGYDFVNAVNGLFIDADGYAKMEAIYADYTGHHEPFAEVCYAGNKKVMETLFAGEVQALSHFLAKLAAQNRRARDLPMYELEALLIEVTACLPVYRTYIRGPEVPANDRLLLERALKLARRRTPPGRVSDDALAFIHRVFLLDPPFYAPEQKQDFIEFMMRWQQFAGPVMAKGLEDTANYAHNSLVSLNEVGGDPLREALPLDPEAFHLFNRTRQERWPATMNATSTHDTKRSEDVRARINVLSELPEEWRACLGRWSRLNAAHKRRVQGRLSPSADEEVLLYQTLLGAWPLAEEELNGFPERMQAYMLKAVREAKVHTSWIQEDSAHEAAVQEFVAAILDPAAKGRFLADFARFQKKIAFYGAINALGQTLLKITSPGLPDFYQGTELWNLRLVDPDNRGPVDFAGRIRALDELKQQQARGPANLLPELLGKWEDGRIKLYLTWKALNLRRERHELFSEGEYVPLAAEGSTRDNVVAFARRRGEQWAVVAAPRLVTQLADQDQWPLGTKVWGTAAVLLPRGAPPNWRNALTGEAVKTSVRNRMPALRLSSLFASFPVALIVSGET